MPIPRRRYMRGNAGTEAPTSFLFFDTESHSNLRPDGNRTDLTLRLWTACHVRREGTEFREAHWHRGTTAAAFWALVDSVSDWKRPLWLFAHNLGHDLTQCDFWSELERRRYTAGPIARPGRGRTGKKKAPWRGRMCLENRPTFLFLRGARGPVKMVDTGNYWPLKLAAVGKRLGFPKLDIDFTTCTDAELFTYCERDTEICRVAVCDLVKWWLENDCGTFQPTAPLLALTEWRHTTRCRAKEGKDTSLVLELDSPSRKAERESAYGGRVEAFYVGTHKGPLWHLDCNSLYPYVMQRGLFPRARVRSPGACNLSELRAWVEAYGVVALVVLDCQRSDDTYPIRANGVQVHATGNFATWLCGDELRAAVRRGHVTDVLDCHLFSVAPLFADWARKWLDRRAAARAAGDAGQEEFCKLILNSLAGKFAQRGEVWVDAAGGPVRRGWGQTIDIDHDTRAVTRWRWVAGHTQRKTPGKEPLNAFPAIYGFVTAAAREFMKGVFALLPPESCLYTATDSIVATEPGLRALRRAGLVHPTKPGKFKLEGPYGEAEIHGANWYRLDGRWTIGGLHGHAEQDTKGEWYADIWDRLGSLLDSNPHGVCGFTRTHLKALTCTAKNDPAGDGWRRPYRFTPVDGFSDRPPRSPHWYFAEPASPSS